MCRRHTKKMKQKLSISIERERGHGVFIKAHSEVDIYNEIFTKINLEKAKRDLTNNIDALVYIVDELNRAPSVSQNQFFGLGDGTMDYQGRSIKIGKEGYKYLIATANIGNGEFKGTFNIDKGLHNRMHVTLDLDDRLLKPTTNDLMELDERE